MADPRPVIPTTPLGWVRAGVGGIWFVKLAVEPLAFYADLPRSQLAPPGLLRFLPDAVWERVLTPGFLTGFKVVLLALVVLFALGAKPWRPLAVATALALTFHQGLVRGLTFVNHQELALLYCTYVLAVAPAGRREAAEAPETARASLTLMALASLVPYTFIAAHRIAFAAPEIFTGGSLRTFVGALSGLDRDGWGVGFHLIEHPAWLAVAKVVFAVTTVFELLAPLCLVNRTFRRTWLAVMIPFHISTWFLMDIFFWENLILAALLLVDLEGLLARVRANAAHYPRRRWSPVTPA